MTLAALVALDLWLADREAEDRRVEKVGRLFTEEERKRPAAGLTVQAGSESFVYVKIAPDEWRCINYKSAIASTESIEKGLISRIFETEGHVQSDDPKLVQQYGFDGTGMFKIAVHGGEFAAAALKGVAPAGDVIASVDIGNALADRDSSFMRRSGRPSIWSMDSNVRPLLERPQGFKLPPLLDPGIIPSFWLQKSQRIKMIRVQVSGKIDYELEVRDVQVSPEELKQGKSPFEWVYKKSGSEKLCEQSNALSYTTFLTRAPYADIIEASKFNTLGFDKPVAKLTITPGQGAPMEIFVGSTTLQGGRRAVYNATTKVAYECDGNLLGYLLPQDSLLLSGAVNPWKQLLEMMQGGGGGAPVGPK